MRDVGVLTDKKREILWDIFRLLPGYNGIVKTFANVHNTWVGEFVLETQCYNTIYYYYLILIYKTRALINWN